MVTVRFTPNLRRHIDTPEVTVEASTVREALTKVFSQHTRLARYIFDDQQNPRQHIMIFLDGEQVAHSETLADKCIDGSEIYVMQALSGG